MCDACQEAQLECVVTQSISVALFFVRNLRVDGDFYDDLFFSSDYLSKNREKLRKEVSFKLFFDAGTRFEADSQQFF